MSETEIDLPVLGHWQDKSETVFVLNEPVDLGQGRQMKTLDFSVMVIPEGITKAEIIQAMTNQVEETTELVGARYTVAIKCPRCGQIGQAEGSTHAAMLDLDLDYNNLEDRSDFTQILKDLEGKPMSDKTLCPACQQIEGAK